MQASFSGNLKGLKDLENNLKKIGEFQIRVGILGEGIHEGSSDTIAGIGATHEFGLIKANIPRRSFLVDTLEDEKLDVLFNFIASALEKTIEKKLTAKQAANKIGAFAQALVVAAFSTGGFGKWAPLSEETIEKKGSSVILVETSTLKRSITFDVSFSEKK